MQARSTAAETEQQWIHWSRPVTIHHPSSGYSVAVEEQRSGNASPSRNCMLPSEDYGTRTPTDYPSESVHVHDVFLVMKPDGDPQYSVKDAVSNHATFPCLAGQRRLGPVHVMYCGIKLVKSTSQG